MIEIEKELLYPSPLFAESFNEKAEAGQEAAKSMHVAFVGLARNCGSSLHGNLLRMKKLAESFASWSLHIEENDSTDNTKEVLLDFCARHEQATCTVADYGRKHYTAEFAGPRTEALAEYREKCANKVPKEASVVIPIDFDAWGGWSHLGVMNGIGWLEAMPEAYGMASVSLIQMNSYALVNNKLVLTPQWMQYDAWALRLNSSWDDYSNGKGGWKHQWLPPVGSPPVRVVSAFGGLCIYKADDFKKGFYAGHDCEHVPFHCSVTEATGRHLYLNPSQRCVMRWQEQTTDDGKHSDDMR